MRTALSMGVMALLVASAPGDTLKLSTGRVVTGKVTQVSGSIIEFRVGNRVTFYSLSNLDPSERARFGGGAPAAKPVAQPASASAAPRSATTAPSAVESARPARSSSVSRGPADRALARALADGDAAAALAALAADAGQANGAGYHDRSGLCEVIALHMDDVAERMISMGSDVNVKGAGDKTPLHWAGRENNAKIAQLLLSKGASVAALDDRRRTPLHSAAGQGSVAAGEVLIAAGADVNAKDQDGITPLHAAAGLGSMDGYIPAQQYAKSTGYPDMVKLLLERGADPNVADSVGGATPLHFAAGAGNEQSVELLLAAKAYAGAADGDGFLPIHRAAETGSVAAVAAFVSIGFDADTPTKSGIRPLHLAAGGGHLALASFLLDRRANPNALAPYYRAGFFDHYAQTAESPLQYAARNGHREMCELLLQRGADITQRDGSGANVLFDAMRANVGETPDPAYGLICFLVAKGADINCQRTGDGATPLLLAIDSKIRDRSLNVVNFLLDQKVDVNLAYRNGVTPLHGAVSKGWDDVVERMLKMGADVSAVDGRYQTALHLAAAAGNDRIAEALLKSGADVNARDDKANTPLHLAAKTGRRSLCELLLRYGAKANTTNKDGKMPFDVAREAGRQDVIFLLQDAASR
ncbi:MAG TPA: ankyrin repeat domain-containing protein [Kiritimatiellia bacterium]|nr:ankyrin repeat domain-containing protein [Kiritimatiellia bacterium]